MAAPAERGRVSRLTRMLESEKLLAATLLTPGMVIRTTVGRVVFNDILHAKMAFHDLSLSSKHLSRIIADCYQLMGRRRVGPAR